MGRYTVNGLMLSELEDEYSKKIEDYSLVLDKIIRLNEDYNISNNYNEIIQTFAKEDLSKFITLYNQMKDNPDIGVSVHSYADYIYNASKPYISYNRDNILESLLNI